MLRFKIDVINKETYELTWFTIGDGVKTFQPCSYENFVYSIFSPHLRPWAIHIKY